MEIELYQNVNNPIEFIQVLGTSFAKSGLFGCGNIESGQTLAAICLFERKTPTSILRTFDIVDGKLRKKALAALGEFRNKGGKHKWIKTGDDGIEAVGEFTFEGQTLTVKFTIDDARRQGLVRDKSNWVKSPGNMLRARVASNAVAMLCPEIFAGDNPADDETVSAKETVELFPQTAPKAEPQKNNAQSAIEVQSEVIVPTASIPEAAKPTEQPTAPAEVKGSNPEPQPAVDLSFLESIEADANSYLVRHGWVKTGQTFRDLKPEQAQKIATKKDGFLNAIKPKDSK